MGGRATTVPVVLAAAALLFAFGVVDPAHASGAGTDAAYQRLVVSGRKSYTAANLKAAGKDFRKALALDPEGAEALVGLGLVLAEQSPQEAIPLLEKGLGKDPGNARGHAMLGVALQTTGREADAVRAYRRYLELSPQGELAGELRAIVENLDPAAAAAQTDLREGLLLFESKEYEAAAKRFEAVRGADPTNFQARKLLGTCYGKTGRLALAAREYEEFVHLAPGDPQVPKVVKILKDYFAKNPTEQPRYPLP